MSKELKIYATTKTYIETNDEVVLTQRENCIITHMKSVGDRIMVTVKFKRFGKTTYFSMVDINEFEIREKPSIDEIPYFIKKWRHYKNVKQLKKLVKENKSSNIRI